MKLDSIKIHYQKIFLTIQSTTTNLTVTSSNFTGNDGMIRILDHFMAKILSKLIITDKNVTQ